MANFYKKPFIYLPKKKKIVQSGNGGSTSFGSIAVEHSYIKSGLGGSNLITFWLTPQERRSAGVPPLYLYDPITAKNQEVNYSMAWANTSRRLYVLMLRLNYTPSNIPNTRWADPNNWWSNVNLPVIYLFVSFTNATNHLYRISSPNMFNNYRMTMHNSNYALTNNNGYIRGVYADETRYSNIINNSTIQSTISGYNVYGSYLIYLQSDVTDAEILNMCEAYDMTGVTQVEALTI